MKIPSRSDGFLSTDERTLLRKMLGQDVYCIYSPWIDAAFDHFECGSLSFALRRGTGFLVLDTEWEEDENLEDFGWLNVGCTERAKSVQYSEEGYPWCPSTISLTPSSPIARITVFRKHLSPQWEFDHALLFEHEERFSYVISYEPEAYQRLVVSFGEAAIDKAIGTLRGEPI